MNENKMTYTTKLVGRAILALISWSGLVYLLWVIQALNVIMKVILISSLLTAMILNIYNGRENRYYDFKQPLENLSKLDESAFTCFIERLYRTLGYYTKLTMDGNHRFNKRYHEIILRKDDKLIIMHCYKDREMSLCAVQTLVGRLSSYPKNVQGQLLTNGTVDEKTRQLATLNEILIVEGEQLKQNMAKASWLLEGYLDGAISVFLCHPIRAFKQHFLEAEPRFMPTKAWQKLIKLELTNRGYLISDANSPKEYGVQFVAQKADESMAIMCIGLDGRVSEHDLNALKASLPFYEVSRGVLFTNTHITYGEKKLAKRLGLELLNFNEYMNWVKKVEIIHENN